MALRTLTVRVTTTGSAGAATGTARIGVPPCRLVGVGVDYAPTAPATTVVKLQDVGVGGTRDVVTVSAGNTDIPIRQVVEPLKQAGALATDVPSTESPTRASPLFANGNITVAVSASNAIVDCVTVTLVIEV